MSAVYSLATVGALPTETISGLRVCAGSPVPFGATPLPGAINFSIPSNPATAMTLVLLRKGDLKPFAELPFPDRFRTGGVYAVTVFGLEPDEIEYGYRAEGPAGSGEGHRFDPGRILADPYATAVGGCEEWGAPRDPEALYPYRSRVARRSFDWEGDRPLGLPMRDAVIYELHVRGFTRHAASGVKAPGTYAGLAEKIGHLARLGVNCVELMPIFEFDECDNARSDPGAGRPLYNYWGYNTVSYFAPKASFAAGTDPAGELKDLVKQLHRAGIEIILDVVFNHTAEGDERGPTISFRGLDNRAYYMLGPDGSYWNFSGTGNTFNANDPVARAFVLDCLRHWVTEFHVDGFRFDLASALGRATDGTPLANPPLLEAIAADPVLRDSKLIAEAWDAAGLYQVGSFPDYRRWSEWNGRYRDAARRFLKGDAGAEVELAQRILGSPDLYGARGPAASVNFITAHDGFTLHDLYAYNEKHNEANGEDSRDGERDNHSWNCGHEGPTDDPEVRALRARQTRNALLILLTSHGVPMLTAGDEMGRSQQGNNNAYCHDELSWLDWCLAQENADLIRFTARLIAFRRAHPALRPGTHSEAARWSAGGGLVAVTLREGADIVHLMVNAHWEQREADLPALAPQLEWRTFADTAASAPFDAREPGREIPVDDQARVLLPPRSARVLVAAPVSRSDDQRGGHES
jgi:isoamylase